MKWCVGSDWKQAIKCPGHGLFAVVSVVSWEHNVLLICPQLGSETELEERNSVSATIILALKLRWSRSRLFCVSSVLSLPEKVSVWHFISFIKALCMTSLICSLKQRLLHHFSVTHQHDTRYTFTELQLTLKKNLHGHRLTQITTKR